MGLPLVSHATFRPVAWTALAGTPQVGYELSRLTDLDPSYPLWIQESSIELQGDIGSALRVDVVTMHHHNFPEGMVVRRELNASPTWGGTPAIRVDATVGAWSADGFAPNVVWDIGAAQPVIVSRTLRYLHLMNMSPSSAPVQIGELVVGGVVVDVPAGMTLPLTRTTAWGVTFVEGKKGPRYLHDRRTRARSWSARLFIYDSHWTAFREVLAASKAMAYPMLVWPTNARTDEPVLGRWSSIQLDEEFQAPMASYVSAIFEELAFGEAY